MARKTEEIQAYAECHDSKNFFAAVKASYYPLTRGSVPLLSSDGSALLMEKPQILKRCGEHFRNVFSRSSAISDAASDQLT
ncbi:hypothetical protein SprV_0301307600 [Sparganum proliferum]